MKSWSFQWNIKNQIYRWRVNEINPINQKTEKIEPIISNATELLVNLTPNPQGMVEFTITETNIIAHSYTVNFG